MAELEPPIKVSVKGRIATITLNRPKQYNAFHPEDYAFLSKAMYELDKREDTLVTVWQGNGKWFSSGAFVSGEDISEVHDARSTALQKTVHNTDLTRALYNHSKILVAALNGPVLGIAAAYLGYFDLIYAHPKTYLALPFSAIGIVAEGGSSVTFVQRLGVGKAKEVLFFGKKIGAEELERFGFVNKIFDAPDTPAFHAKVHAYLEDMTQDLNSTAIFQSKKLIQEGLRERNNPDAVNLRESFTQLERFLTGEPVEVFQQLARKERKHRL